MRRVLTFCLPLALLATLLFAFAAFAHPVRDGAGAILTAQTTSSDIVVANYGKIPAAEHSCTSATTAITHNCPPGSVIMVSSVRPTRLTSIAPGAVATLSGVSSPRVWSIATGSSNNAQNGIPLTGLQAASRRGSNDTAERVSSSA